MSQEPVFLPVSFLPDWTGREVHLRDENGRLVPSGIREGREPCFIASCPPDAVATYTFCAGPQEVDDLEPWVETEGLGSGHGRIEVRTSRLRAVWEEVCGGTLTELESRATGAQFASQAFGAGYGRFSQENEDKVTQTSTEFIQEDKVNQRDGTGRLEVAEVLPGVSVSIRCLWEDDKVRAEQLYTLYAHADCFDVRAKLHPKTEMETQERVVLDARLKAEPFAKIFPNFVGIAAPAEASECHFGWREAPFVPPYATLMSLSKEAEAVSLFVLENEAIDRFRQGFWPEKRPTPGPRTYAQAEYIQTGEGDARLLLRVKLHKGRQKEARLYLEGLCSRRTPVFLGGAKELREPAVAYIDDVSVERIDP